MSSYNIGPALPPHMRRNQNNDGDSSSSLNEERNGDKQDRYRKKQRDKYDERTRYTNRERNKPERHRDRDRSGDRSRDRSQDRSRDRSRDRSHRFASERGRYRHRSKREDEESSSSRKERIAAKREECTDTSSSRRSKRSKSDRTYNTDTEESSDENCDVKEWTKKCDSDYSESEQEEKDVGASDSLEKPFDDENKVNSSAKDICGSDEDNLIGPALPPHLIKDSCSFDSGVVPSKPSLVVLAESEENSPSASEIGPALPPHLRTKVLVEKIAEGDVLPSELPALSAHDYEACSASECIVGPALPPHLLKVQESEKHLEDEPGVIGPLLPPLPKASKILGPTIPVGLSLDSMTTCDSSSDEEVVGPLLPEQMTSSGKNYLVQAKLEQNAAAIKRKLEKKDVEDGSASRREEWMLELPPESTVDLGLGPRSFRMKGAPEKGADRSAWTDTPADKLKKEEEAKQRFELGMSSTTEVRKAAASKDMSAKDKSMEAVVKKHKRSKESLLEAHQRKLKEEKKKKEKDGAKKERRPFNRDLDLKTNVFDDAQKKAIYKKAQFLDNRFSSGESKYL